jgi:hypothetical protein
MVDSSNGVLLYRATIDGFEASSFHGKCDGKENTVTIIKTDSNYVFGGYTAAKWVTDTDEQLNNGGWIHDSTAFIFSLRRNEVSFNNKFMVKNANHAIYGHSSYGPSFGGGSDIFIIDKSNINIGSYSNLGIGYQYHTEDGDSKSFLAGSSNDWLTNEIEVYQIN